MKVGFLGLAYLCVASLGWLWAQKKEPVAESKEQSAKSSRALTARESGSLLLEQLIAAEKSSHESRKKAQVLLPPSDDPAKAFLDLYHSLKTPSGSNSAWAWLEKFEGGLWRDRGFGQISQHALYRQDDPELSRRALEMINDPAFKQEAEGWRSDWKERQGN